MEGGGLIRLLGQAAAVLDQEPLSFSHLATRARPGAQAEAWPNCRPMQPARVQVEWSNSHRVAQHARAGAAPRTDRFLRRFRLALKRSSDTVAPAFSTPHGGFLSFIELNSCEDL